MKTVIRLDRSAGELKSPTTTPQGFLRCDGHPARAGIYKYRRDDGTIQYERRPHEEVFHADSLASYDDAPLTIEHPAEGEVTADNVRRHEVGHVAGGARQDGDRVATSQVIKDAKAIKLVKAGKQQLSPGYKIKLDETPGHDSRYATPDNPTGRYDATQTEIRVNHVAIVDNARGGQAMRLRMDAAEMVLDDEERQDAPIDSMGQRSSGIVASMHADRAEQHARESQSAASRGDVRGAEEHATMSSEHAVHATDAANVSGTAAGT